MATNEYTISKIELPNGDVCNIKDTTYSAGTGLKLTNTTFKNERGIEYIRGTWTAASNVWTGTSTDSELYDGKQIILYMPFAGTSTAATLNLTLSGGGTTGEKNVYFESTNRFTTHKGQNSQLHLIYHKALVLSNGTTYEGWWYVANRDTTTTNATQIQHNFAVKAGSAAIVRYNIIVADSDGLYKHLKAGTVFDITMPIFYTSADIAANSTATGNYSEINFTVTTTQSISLTTHLPVYIKGTLLGTKFTPISTAPLTQTVPNSDDGYAYMFLGMAYAATTIRLKNYHPIYMYKNNRFQLWLDNSGVTAGSYGDSSNQTPGYGATFKVPYVTVDNKGRVTSISEHTVKIPASDNTNTTYTFENGTNGFKVTPSGGTAQTVTVTPSITNNITGSGTSGYLAKFSGTNTITNGPQLGNDATKFLNNKGEWATALTSHQDISGKVSKSGDTMTGSLKRYYGSASTDPTIAITSNDKDVTALWIGHGTSAGNPTSCYYKLIYKGTGSSPNNTLQLISAKNTTETTAITINEEGNVTFTNTITGSITGNAGTATAFSANKEVKLTGDVTGSASSTGGWSIATTIGEGKVTNAMLAGSIANEKLANSSIKIGNKTISLGGTATLADIGVSYPVTSVAGKTGAVTLAKGDVGLGNVDNTSDANKTVKDLTNFKVSTYTIPGGKGIRITYPINSPVLISCQRSIGGGRLILIGGGYGKEGLVRNNFTEVVSSTHFTWCLPDSSNISNSLEIMVDGEANLQVWSSNTCTFTQITELTSSANDTILLTNKSSLAWSKLTGKPTTISGYGITDAKIASGVITLGSNTITPIINIAGETGSTITADALRAALSLSNAMHFLGVTTTNISTGTANTTATITIGGSNVTAVAGDVVLYGSQEYVWGNSKWNLLGDESSYKVKQTAKSDPTASTSTSTTFIDTISQNTNGVITATKKTLPTASTTVAGITKVGASGGAAAYSHGNHVPTTETANNAKFLRNDNTWQLVTPANIGAVTKLSTSTDNAIVRFDGTSGAIQNSGVTVDDNQNINSVNVLQTGRYFHNVATFSTAGTPKELLIKTKIPFINGNSMPKIIIHMDNYNSGLPTEIGIVFYIYSNAFCNMGVTSNTKHRPKITLCTYTESDQKYVAIGMGLADVATDNYPDAYFVHFNVDFLDIWPSSTRTSYALGWEIISNNTTTSIIPTDDRKNPSYVDQAQTAIAATAANLTTTTNAIAYYTNTTGTFGTKASANGALYATSANGALQWGTLPVAQGGTGATSAADARTNLGLGSIAVKADTDYVLYGGDDTNLGSGSPASTAKTYWADNTKIPDNMLKTYYNHSGSECTLFFSKRATYGSILKWGYGDTYLRILRIQGGTWKSDDWEKISAGYADSAGSATTATNLAAKPSLATSGTTQITVTAGGKTSDAYTIPYATKAGTGSTVTITSHTNTTNGNKTYYLPFLTATSGNLSPHAHSAVYLYETVTDGAISKYDFCFGASTIKGSITLWDGTSHYGNIRTDELSSHRTYDLPNASGTIALMTSNITGTAANVTGTVAINHGGTGATSAEGARTNLELGTMATEAATDYLKLSGGTMTGPLKWNGSNALPEKTSPEYFLVIDAFANGGETYWSSKATVKSTLLGTNSTHNNQFLRKDGTWTTPPYPVTSVAGKTGAITADTLRTSLGLSNAMHFLGVTTTNISTGTANTTATVTIGSSSVDAAAGDVVLYNSAEYVWGNDKWNLLGDESSYKVKQTAKSDPTASTTTSTTFIDTISQDANGVITATKKTLPSYVSTSAGVTAVTWDSTNKKLTRTINDTTTEVVTITTIKTALALTKSDVGLGNVANSTHAGGTAVTLNNSSKASSTASFYAPTTGGTADTQALVGNGTTTAPKWADISPSITIGAGTSSAAPTVNVTILGQSGTAKSITTASTSAYGVTKLNDGITSNSTTLAATANSALVAAKKVASSNSASKLYLVGATSQSATGVDSYSYKYTYTNNGLLSALKLGLNLDGTEKVHLEWNNTDQSIDFIFN